MQFFTRKRSNYAALSELTSSQEDELSNKQFQFRLTNNNPVNTSIRSPDGVILYKSHTTFDNGTVTTVTKPNGQDNADNADNQDNVIAALHWNDMLPDKIAVGGQKPVRIGKLLNAGPLLSETVSMKDDAGRRYQWKGYEAKGRLRLYAVDEPDTPLIAVFQRAVPNLETGKAAPAYLWINPRGQEILDLVIWSFLFLEKNRRAADNGFANRTAGGGSSSV